jgi:broad specificity phosphatase PhoE
MILTLVRHGEVDPAALGRYNGHNGIGLSEKGHAQAEALARRFADVRFDAVYCSDLRRAAESLVPLLRNSGTLPVPVYTSALREKSWGRHEGKSYDEIVSEEGIRYENFLQWIDALDGEPYPDYIARIRRFFLETLPAQPYEQVFIMTHAGVIRVLMHLLQGISLQEAFSVSFPCGAYTTLDLNTRQFGEIVCAA